MDTLAHEQQPLTAADRCDRCGAAARTRITLRSGGVLLFCNHHTTEHRDRLAEVAAYVYCAPPAA